MAAAENLGTLIGGGDCLDHYHHSDRFGPREVRQWQNSLENVTVVTATYSIDGGDDYVVHSSTSNAAIVLPSPVAGRVVKVKRLGFGEVTVTPNATETIDGASSYLVMDSTTFKATGGNWITMGNSVTPYLAQQILSNEVLLWLSM